MERADQLPLAFVENKGQTDPRVKFFCRYGGFITFLTSCGPVFKLTRADVGLNESVDTSGFATTREFLSTAVGLSFEKPNSKCTIEVAELLPGYENYRVGCDPRNWASFCRAWALATYQDVWPGVTITFLERNGNITYDINLSSNADLERVVVQCSGASSLRVSGNGALVISTPLGEIRHEAPVSWITDAEGRRQSVRSRFKVLGGLRFGFESERPGPGERLTIDPGVLVYGKYLGGSGVDKAWSVAVDRDGNAYVTGQTASIDFPSSPYTGFPVFDAVYSGNTDAFVSKINPLGRSLVYSTYLGGAGNDVAYGIDVDRRACAYVCGECRAMGSATGFYTAGAVYFGSTILGNSDAFVARFSLHGFPDSSQTVSPTPPGQFPSDYVGWCSLFGGPGDDGGRGISLEPLPPIGFPSSPSLTSDYPRLLICGYVGATAGSPPYVGSDFLSLIGGVSSTLYQNKQPYLQNPLNSFPAPNPIPPPQAPAPGTTDAFVAQLNQVPYLAFGSFDVDYVWYVGGSGLEIGNGVGWMPNGIAVVCGTTTSTNLPVSTGALQPTFGGGVSDGFLCAIGASFTSYKPQQAYPNMNGTLSIGYLSYLGGSGADDLRGLATDFSNAVVVVGTTKSPGIATAGSASTVLNLGASNGNSDAYVASFGPFAPFPAPAVTLLGLTYLGGSGNDEGNGVALLSTGEITATGLAGPNPQQGVGIDYPQAPIVTVGFGQKDAFVTRLNSTGTQIIFSFLSGGAGDDTSYAVTTDLNGDQYSVGETSSFNFPVTPGTIGPGSLSGISDAFIQKFR